MSKDKTEMQLPSPARELKLPMQLGQVFYESGMFKDIKSQAQAVVKILAGQELGLAPMESMTNVYIVNGKPALQAKVIGALLKKSGKYNYSIEEHTDKICRIFFYEKTNGAYSKTGESEFTIENAAKAGIINKDVWKNYPKNMLFARALTNGARFFCPDVYCGYTPDEIEDLGGEEKEEIVTLTKEGEVSNGETPVQQQLSERNSSVGGAPQAGS